MIVYRGYVKGPHYHLPADQILHFMNDFVLFQVLWNLNATQITNKKSHFIQICRLNCIYNSQGCTVGPLISVSLIFVPAVYAPNHLVTYHMKHLRTSRMALNFGLLNRSENQNIFARLTVRAYVWIVQDWTLQQSIAKSTERQVRAVSYVGETQSFFGRRGEGVLRFSKTAGH